MNNSDNFLPLFKVLENALKGKLICVRKYEDRYRELEWNESATYPIGWNKNVEYKEWYGVVEAVLSNDSSYVGIVFNDELPHTYPDNCSSVVNLHLDTHIKILE